MKTLIELIVDMFKTALITQFIDMFLQEMSRRELVAFWLGLFLGMIILYLTQGGIIWNI